MRRITAVVLIVGLMGIALSASAHQSENYKDKFTSISWGGSDGSLEWSGPWTEIGDDDDEKKGNVRVVSSGNCASGNCLWMAALTTLLGPIGAQRAADTSDLEDITLRFDLCSTSSLLGSYVEVQVTEGEGWTTVAEYELSEGIDAQANIDISDFRSEDFGLRFLFNGLLLSSEVYIDNVEIQGSTAESSTTTTTAPPTTIAPTTTTTRPTTTTTTSPGASPTTTNPGGSGGTPSTIDPESGGTTTTLPGGSTTTDPDKSTTPTTIVGIGAGPGSGGGSDGGGPGGGGSGEGGSGGGAGPDGSGIRAATRGLQADFQADLYGEVRSLSSLDGTDFRADYNMAVEVIEASWAWIALLGLVIAYAIVSGLDRRRTVLAT